MAAMETPTSLLEELVTLTELFDDGGPETQLAY